MTIPPQEPDVNKRIADGAAARAGNAEKEATSAKAAAIAGIVLGVASLVFAVTLFFVKTNNGDFDKAKSNACVQNQMLLDSLGNIQRNAYPAGVAAYDKHYSDLRNSNAALGC